jgi:hypothetical protein
MGCANMFDSSTQPHPLGKKDPRHLSVIMEESSYVSSTRTILGGSPQQSDLSDVKQVLREPSKEFTINPEMI